MLKAEKSPNGNSYFTTPRGIARPCTRCGGSGQHSFSLADGHDRCFRCGGNKADPGKSFSSVEAFDKYLASLDKARERRELKNKLAWEAGAEARQIEREAKERLRLEREVENTRWSHVDGQVGDKVTVTGNISVATSIETQYGTSRLIIIETADRKTVKLFTSAEWSWTAQVDEAVTVSGAIKSFEDFNGRPQTQLIRPKLAW